MCSLQLHYCRALALDRSPPKSPQLRSFSSWIWGDQLSLVNGKRDKLRYRFDGGVGFRVRAMSNGSSSSSFKMNLNEYMVTLEKPLGIRFALSVDGKIFVHALKKGVFFF